MVIHQMHKCIHNKTDISVILLMHVFFNFVLEVIIRCQNNPIYSQRHIGKRVANPFREILLIVLIISNEYAQHLTIIS
jgi:hypothetical protein